MRERTGGEGNTPWHHYHDMFLLLAGWRLMLLGCLGAWAGAWFDVLAVDA